MKILLTVIALTIWFTIDSYSQVPDTLWTKIFDGPGNESGIVQLTADSGYILIGSTSSYGAGDSDVWLIKTDENGNELWSKTFGGSDADYGVSGQQTLDGGYIICSMTKSYGAGDFDAWLIKTDENGNEIWNKTYGGVDIDAGQSLQQTIDGGYIIAGYRLPSGATLIDAWIFKTDENGNLVWDNTYGGEYLDRLSSIQQTSDSGFIATGFTNSFGAIQDDVILIKVDNSGDELWIKTFGGINNEWGNSVLQTQDSGYVLIGFTNSYGSGAADFWLIKTNDDGNEIWNKTFGGPENDYGVTIIKNSQGNFVISGSTESFGSGSRDVWLIKTDENGNDIWSTTFGTNQFEFSSKVFETLDGGYIISATRGEYGTQDIWLIKTTQDVTSVESNSYLVPTKFSLFQNYPNPFNPSTIIKYQIPKLSFVTLRVYDVLGNEIEALVNEEKPIGDYEIEFDATALPSGIYFYSLQAGSFVETKKMILMK